VLCVVSSVTYLGRSRSAGFQPAVSRISNPLKLGLFQGADLRGVAFSE